MYDQSGVGVRAFESPVFAKMLAVIRGAGTTATLSDENSRPGISRLQAKLEEYEAIRQDEEPE